MTAQSFLETAGIPLLLFAVLVYYGVRLLILGDVSAIRGKNKPPVKDEKRYAKEAGKLMLFFAAVTLVMMFLLFINVYVAVAAVVCGTVILGILWSRMDKKYGDG